MQAKMVELTLQFHKTSILQEHKQNKMVSVNFTNFLCFIVVVFVFEETLFLCES
jgi:hypothetical protein